MRTLMKTMTAAGLLACMAASAAGAAAMTMNEFNNFRGEYDLQDGRRLSISSHQHKFYARVDMLPEVEIVPDGEAGFIAKNGGLRLQFRQAPNGNVSAVTVLR